MNLDLFIYLEFYYDLKIFFFKYIFKDKIK